MRYFKLGFFSNFDWLSVYLQGALSKNGNGKLSGRKNTFVHQSIGHLTWMINLATEPNFKAALCNFYIKIKHLFTHLFKLSVCYDNMV